MGLCSVRDMGSSPSSFSSSVNIPRDMLSWGHVCCHGDTPYLEAGFWGLRAATILFIVTKCSPIFGFEPELFALVTGSPRIR